MAINNRLTLIAVTLVVCLVAGKVQATDPPDRDRGERRGPPPFSYLDRNGDGILTLPEFRSQPIPEGEHDAVFATIDGDGDGIITEAEFTSHKPPQRHRGERRGPPPFSYLDRNGDGILTLPEFRSQPIPEGGHDSVFATIDGDGDGIITEAEFTNHKPPQGHRGERRSPSPFSYFDQNGDGILTLPEFRIQPIPEGEHDAVFATIDGDGDGIITEAEFPNHKPSELKRPSPPPQSLDEQLDPTRIKLVEPSRVVRLMDIHPGATVLDLGAGYGLFTFLLAEAAGEEGRVFATDIDETVIDYLSGQISENGVDNVEAVLVSTEATDPFYVRHTYDAIFISDVWWDIDTPRTFFDVLRPLLRPKTGRIWILSWRLDPDFSASEFAGIGETLEALESPGNASLIRDHLSADVRDALASRQGEVTSAITDRLIADLNRMLDDWTLWPAVQDHARSAGTDVISKPEQIGVALRLARDLEAKGAFEPNAQARDEHSLKLLRGLNRMLIQNALRSDVWKNAFGPSDHSLRFWLDWEKALREGEEPTILSEIGYELVREHVLLHYHRILEFKRRP